MMKGGLLHTPPPSVIASYHTLFKNIELCVESSDKFDRFHLSDIILKDLKNIFSDKINDLSYFQKEL